MGMIRIVVVGSFNPSQTHDFSAMQGGHAQAVAEAIAWLSKSVLPQAILQDHRLQAEGAFPENGFGVNRTLRTNDCDEWKRPLEAITK